MRKKSNKSLFIAIAVIFVNLSVANADIVYLKNGGSVEGKIIESTDKEYKIKVRTGTLSINKADVKNIEEKPVDLSKIHSPQELYKLKSSKIKDNNAPAHFELGVFCFESRLYDEALGEFNTAKDLDLSYVERVDAYITKIKKVKSKKKKKKIEKKKEERKKVFTINKEDEGKPELAFDPISFKMFLSTFEDEVAREEYLEGCFLKAQEATEQASRETDPKSTQRALYAALDYYRASSLAKDPEISRPAVEGSQTLLRKLIESEDKVLNVPVGRLQKESNEFLSSIPPDEVQSYCHRYLEMAKEIEEELSSMDSGSKESKSRVRAALNCYMLVYNFTDDLKLRKKVLLDIKRCNRLLK